MERSRGHGVQAVVRVILGLVILFVACPLVACRASAQDAGRPDARADGGALDEEDRRFEAFRRTVDSDPFTDRGDDPIGRGDARDE